MADRRGLACLLALAIAAALSSRAVAEEPAALIETIKSVGREGDGNAKAAAALGELGRQSPQVLPEILRAFDGAGPIPTNYLRGAFEAIADRAIAGGTPLPVKELEAFVRDRSGNPRARRLAYEWLVKVDPSAKERLVSGMLDDPSPELRRDAVQRLIDEANAHLAEKREDEARVTFRKALGGAVDDDQVKAIAGPLRKLGEKIDLQKHFGFLTEWRFIGPFDNRGMKGFAESYAPETRLDLESSYDGKEGKVAWTTVETDDEYGKVDIAEQISPYKGAVMYAVAEFDSPKAQAVEFRLGTPNAWKLWVNGQLLFAREEYHRGMALDQYRVPAQLKAGRNVILFKICQNEQEQDWAQRYAFQMRVCDATGAAVLPRSGRQATRGNSESTSRDRTQSARDLTPNSAAGAN